MAKSAEIGFVLSDIMMPGGMDGIELVRQMRRRNLALPVRPTKLGQLSGVSIARIVNPVGVRVRCEFVSAKHPSIEFEISGDLALGIAKEMELLLPHAQRRKAKPSGG